MGVAQTFAGLARVVAPMVATTRLPAMGHGWPFYLAGGVVALAGMLTLQIPRGPGTRRRRRRRAPHDTCLSSEDRLDRLEQRMAVLETLVRQLAAGVARRRVAPVTASRRTAPPRPCRTQRRRRRPGAATAAAAAPRPRHRRRRAGRPTPGPARRGPPPRLRAVDRTARIPGHRRGRAADGDGLPVQAFLRTRLDFAGDALHRRVVAGVAVGALDGASSPAIAPTVPR